MRRKHYCQIKKFRHTAAPKGLNSGPRYDEVFLNSLLFKSRIAVTDLHKVS
jgi:hypothetical protein